MLIEPARDGDVTSHLRLLVLHGVKFSDSLNCLSNKLRYVWWHGYPFMYLPSSFQPDALVGLSFNYSMIKQLWEGNKYIPSLIRMDLSHCENLEKLPDFGEVPNLEWLSLEGCIKLVEIDPPIGLLRKLAYLNLKNCKNLESIPSNITGLTSLQHLNLSGCSKVCNNQLTSIAGHLKRLDISETAMPSQSKSSFIGRILPLLFGSSHSSFLHSFSCLTELDLSFCDLIEIPDAIGSLQGLEFLNLEGNKFVTVTCSLKDLSKLAYLNLSHCMHLTSLPELPSCTYVPAGNERRRLTLYIFNCPNLGERERCSSTIMFSWMIKSMHSFTGIDIVTPGSEIPRWFSNQSAGSSKSMDVSPIMHDNDWIGIACCAVFVARPITLTNEQKPYLKIGFKCKGEWLIGKSMLVIDGYLVKVKSDYIWLFHFSREQSNDFMRRASLKKDIKMVVWFRSGRGLQLKLKLKKCAYHWVFKEDVELLKMYCGDSSA